MFLCCPKYSKLQCDSLQLSVNLIELLFYLKLNSLSAVHRPTAAIEAFFFGSHLISTHHLTIMLFHNDGDNDDVRRCRFFFSSFGCFCLRI